MKKLKKLGLVAGTGILAAGLAAPTFAEEPTTVDTTKTVTEEKKEKKPFMSGSLYGEAGALRGDLFGDQEYGYLTLNLGHPWNVGKGTLIAPQFRLRGYFSGNEFDQEQSYSEATAGIGYKIGPVSARLFAGHREYMGDSKQESGELVGAGVSLWNRWNGKDLSKSEAFPFKPRTTLYADVSGNTLIDNIVAVARIEQELVVAKSGKLSFGPYVAAKVNKDANGESWYNYADVSGGVKVGLGKLVLKGEVGQRTSFNDGPEGNFARVAAMYFTPINF